MSSLVMLCLRDLIASVSQAEPWFFRWAERLPAALTAVRKTRCSDLWPSPGLKGFVQPRKC